MCVWLCSVPVECGLLYLLIKSHANSSPRWRLSNIHVYVHIGVTAPVSVTGWLLVPRGVLANSVCGYVCVYVHVQRCVPATGAELLPWEIEHPGRSKWWEWDTNAACIWEYIHLLAGRPPPCSAGEGSRMRLPVLFVFVVRACLWFLWLAAYTCMFVVYMCALSVCTVGEYMLSLTTRWTWRYRAAAALPVSGCWIWANSSNTLPCSSMSYLRCISLLFFSLRFFTFSNSLLLSDSSTVTSYCCHCQTVFCCRCPLHCSYHLWITGRRNLSGHKLWISAGAIPCSVTSLGIANPWLWFHGVSPDVWGRSAWEAAILCLMCCAGSLRVSLYVQWGWLTSGRETFMKPHREHIAESTGAISLVKVCQDSCIFHWFFFLIRYANKMLSFHYPLKQLCDCNLKA